MSLSPSETPYIGTPVKVGPILGWLRKKDSDADAIWLQRVMVVASQGSLGKFIALRIELLCLDTSQTQQWYCDAKLDSVSGQQTATFDLPIKQPGSWRITVESVSQTTPYVGLASSTATLMPQHFVIEGSRTFCISSCRFPGFGADTWRADAVLFKIASQKPSFCLFLGDSIYADSAQVRSKRAEAQRYSRAYEDAFNSPGFAAVLRTTPSYFIPDDHEFANDWHADQYLLDRPSETAWFDFSNAFNAFSEFEFGHGARNAVEDLPLAALNEDLSLLQNAPATKFRVTGQLSLSLGASSGKWGPHYRWSDAQLAGIPFFLADTRSERQRLGDRHAIWSSVQFEHLSRWLLSQDANGLKFIALSQPVAPAPLEVARDKASGANQDAWWGYPDSLIELLTLIATSGQQGIVLLAGDSHFGTSCKLRIQLGERAPIEVLSVVSSGLYIPLRGVNAKRSDYFVQNPALILDCYENGWLRYDPGCAMLSCGEYLHTQVLMDCPNTVFSEHFVNISVSETVAAQSSISLSPPPWPTLDFVLVNS